MKMNNEHLNDCLEQMLKGQDLESCLAKYPEEDKYIRPLLQAAFGIKQYADTVHLSPQFIEETRAKLSEAYENNYPIKQARAHFINIPLRRLAEAAAIAIFASILTFTGGFAVSVRASEGAMPGETFYTVKLATEEIILAMTFTNEGKINYLTQFAETRAEEIAYSVTQGDNASAEANLQRLEDCLSQVREIINDGGNKTSAIENHQLDLIKIQDIVNDSYTRVKPSLETIKKSNLNKSGATVPDATPAVSDASKQSGTDVNPGQTSQNTANNSTVTDSKSEIIPGVNNEQPGTGKKTEVAVSPTSEPVPNKNTQGPAADVSTNNSEKPKDPPGNAQVKGNEEDKTPPEKKADEHSEDKKDKIVDRIDKAYEDTKGEIEKARAEKSSKK